MIPAPNMYLFGCFRVLSRHSSGHFEGLKELRQEHGVRQARPRAPTEGREGAFQWRREPLRPLLRQESASYAESFPEHFAIEMVLVWEGSDVTGPSHHWMSNVAYKARTPPRPESGAALVCSALALLDFVGALAVAALGRLNLLATLLAQDADKAAHRMRLPVRGFHDLPNCCAFGAPH